MLKTLQEIYIDKNRLSRIGPGMMIGLSSLWRLNAGYNKIRYIEQGE